jgi:two-component system, chemotaxis family, protein-glutamate methylesterase/glutaminase
VPISIIGDVLENIITNKEISSKPIPNDVKVEAEIAEKMATGIEVVSRIGTNSVFTCPDCGGVLFNVDNGKALRFRCHTGHSYTQEDLEIKQAENVEATLWVALRMMEERKSLLHKMEDQTRSRGFERFAREHSQKAEELQQHIERMKKILAITQEQDET